MESNNDTTQSPRHKSRRSRRSRHGNLKIWALSLALLFSVVIMFITLVYNGSRIDSLTSRANAAQEQLFLKEQKIEELSSRLAQSNSELERFLEGRLPSVMRLDVDQVLVINQGFLKNIVFSVVSQDGDRAHEYKLVLENLTHSNIVPKFRVLVFDKYGVQIGIDQVLTGDELAPGESRSYSSSVKFFMNEKPAYFKVSSLIPPEALHMQKLLELGEPAY